MSAFLNERVFALSLLGAVAVGALIMLVLPPARDSSILFRNWTQSKEPGSLAEHLSASAWRRLTRLYFAGVLLEMMLLAALVYWVLPANRALPIITLTCLVTTYVTRFAARRYLRAPVTPVA